MLPLCVTIETSLRFMSTTVYFSRIHHHSTFMNPYDVPHHPLRFTSLRFVVVGKDGLTCTRDSMFIDWIVWRRRLCHPHFHLLPLQARISIPSRFIVFNAHGHMSTNDDNNREKHQNMIFAKIWFRKNIFLIIIL